MGTPHSRSFSLGSCFDDGWDTMEIQTAAVCSVASEFFSMLGTGNEELMI